MRIVELSAAVRGDNLDDGPADGTMSLGRTAMVWLAADMVVTTLLTGTLFVPGIPYGRALLLILLGTLVGGSVLIAIGNIGTRTGLPTMVLTRGSFGRRGGYLPAAFNLVVLMGWSWVQATSPASPSTTSSTRRRASPAPCSSPCSARRSSSSSRSSATPASPASSRGWP